MNKIFFLLVCIQLQINVFKKSRAQDSEKLCGTEIPSTKWEEIFQEQIENYKKTHASNKQTQTTYTIPIIFHIIHGGQATGTFPNLSQGQINSQIDVLNEDYSGLGLNSGNYPADAFVNWAINQALPQANLDASGRVKIADVGIRFCLAEKDTLGNPLTEPGIERINYSSRGWTNPNTFTSTSTLRSYMDGTIKPQSIWDVTKYLNIWVSDRNSAIMYTGYATMPPLSTLGGIISIGTDSTDGIWCYAKALGSYSKYPQGAYAVTSVEGRTITHEAGHYLGLRHIWGDSGCASDYCDDTPPAAAQNTGAPTYPLNVGSCSSPGNSPDGEMFMNFMDYPSDPNKYMFTVDQATRMQTAMLNSPFRKQLGTHGLCSTLTTVNDSFNSNTLTVFPNPTTGAFHVKSKETIKAIRIYNYSGQLLKETKSNEISIEEFPAGIYAATIIFNAKVMTVKIIKE